LPTAGLPGRDLSAALGAAAPVPPADWVTSSGDATHLARLADGTAVIVPDDEMAARFGWQPQQFDLAADPLERAPQPLDERGRELLRFLGEAREADPFSAWQGQGADEETLEMLRELGYVR
jgi:hypothetical protein